VEKEKNNMVNQQFLKKWHIGLDSDCENGAGPDIGLMGRKNKIQGVIAIMSRDMEGVIWK
jgi:hypothetical protein